MRARFGRLLPFLAAAAALTAGCGAETGTFVKLLFDGSVNQDQPIASIALDLQLGARTTSTSFPMPSSNPRLPTTGVLQIGSGAGTLYVSAKALAADGSVLGTGAGSATVLSGKTVEITVLFTGFVVPDAGTDGPETDTQPPRIDTGIDGGADGAAERASEVAGPVDVPPSLDAPDQDAPPLADARAEAADTTADAPPDIAGKGGAGGSGGTAAGGAGGTGTGGAGGGTGGTSASYLLVVNPPAVDFGIFPPGTTSPAQTFTIINKGSVPAPALVTSVSDPAHFPIAQDTCKGMTLAPTATCTVSFAFSPTAPGSIRADCRVGPTDGAAPGAKFSLSGTGAGGVAALALAPSPVTFGQVDVNQAVAIPMTLTNGGDGSAGTVAVQVTNSPTFKVTNDTCSGVSLGARSQCTFTLVFTPTTFGPTSATVTAQASSGLSASVSASGTGRDSVLLTIQFAGTGAGVVNGVNPPCTSPNPCSISVARTDPAALPKYDLTAQANALSVFGGWGGDCATAGTGTCSVIMDKPHAVTATFNPRMVSVSLTVLGVSGGAGTLVSEDGTISCSGSCPNLSHAATTSFTLNAKPASGSSFIAWTSGPCRGTNPSCPFSLTDPVAITATFAPQQAYMFVTSSTVVPGTLGGLEGADKECQRLADKAALPGTYVAWLSTSIIDARSRVGEGGWMRTDGRPFTYALKTLADSMVKGYPTVYYPPRLDEQGNDLGNVPILVATGGNTDGTSLGDQCGDYTKTTGDLYVGDASSGSFAWSYTQIYGNGCAKPFHLYCFRKDVAGGIRPPVQEGRRVFVTPKPFSIGGSLNSPTLACQNAASDAGVPDPGSFVAFLATSSTPAIKLLKSAGPPWKRLDEVIVANQVSDLANGKLLAPINLAPDGFTYLPNRVWTGATDPSAPGTATCNDWRSNMLSVPALVGDSRTTAAPAWFSLGNVGATACNDSNTHLMCIQP